MQHIQCGFLTADLAFYKIKDKKLTFIGNKIQIINLVAIKRNTHFSTHLITTRYQQNCKTITQICNTNKHKK